ncbi:putative tRNA pseudouridine(38-40) synthase [Helianthus debilis subsp. tardiflorus]
METQNPNPVSPSSSPPPPPSLPLPPPPHEEPDSKRLKMSTTTSNDPNTTTTERKPRYKRRKVAILFAYCGVGYQGMQKNPGAKTIEGDLEEALYFSGAVLENERGCPNRYDFARSARTDKGVSAVGQVVSGKFYVDPPGFVERLNSNLPAQFRVFGFKRVTASFSAKKFCDRRRYVYLLPVFALDGKAHCEGVKCLECLENGWRVYGAGFESDVQSGISSNTSCAVSDSGCLDNGNGCKDGLNSESLIGEVQLVDNSSDLSKTGSDVEIQPDILSNTLSAVSDSDGKVENLASLDNGNGCKDALNPGSAENSSDLGKKCDDNSGSDAANGGIVKENVFSYDDEKRQRFNKILKQYEGTHNFHNFTTRTKAADPSANRYIISFSANTTVTVDGMEFVKCEVVGQSFMLHQIRKMIGVAVAVMRNFAPESLIETALQQDVNINVPTAPEVGLYLDECFFSSYNQKWRDTHEEVSMKAYAEEAEEFKLKHIYSHIASTERKEGSVAVWLHSLDHRRYPDLRPEEKSEANEVAIPQTE